MMNLIFCLVVLVLVILGIASQVGYFKALNRNVFGGNNEVTPQPSEGFERRSLIQKSRRMLWHGLLYGLVGLLSLIGWFILSIHCGVIYLVIGFLVTVSALIIFQARSYTRCLANLIQTTPCPRCGKFPMNYLARSADGRRLLVCTQCRTEWDLGPAAL